MVCRGGIHVSRVPTGSTKRPGRDESLPYYLKNENARRVPTAGIVHAINY